MDKEKTLRHHTRGMRGKAGGVDRGNEVRNQSGDGEKKKRVV